MRTHASAPMTANPTLAADANQTPIEHVWTSPKMRELRELHKRGEFYKNPICNACALSSTVNHAVWDR